MKSLMNMAAILPAHLSEPVTSVLLISRTGSYSAIPEGRKEGRNTCIFHTDGLSSMKLFFFFFALFSAKYPWSLLVIV